MAWATRPTGHSSICGALRVLCMLCMLSAPPAPPAPAAAGSRSMPPSPPLFAVGLHAPAPPACQRPTHGAPQVLLPQLCLRLAAHRLWLRGGAQLFSQDGLLAAAGGRAVHKFLGFSFDDVLTRTPGRLEVKALCALPAPGGPVPAGCTGRADGRAWKAHQRASAPTAGAARRSAALPCGRATLPSSPLPPLFLALPEH